MFIEGCKVEGERENERKGDRERRARRENDRRVGLAGFFKKFLLSTPYGINKLKIKIINLLKTNIIYSLLKQKQMMQEGETMRKKEEVGYEEKKREALRFFFHKLNVLSS